MSFVKSFRHNLKQSRPVLQALSLVLNLLAPFIRRDKKLVLCGAMNGRWYGDNSKYVYEWILNNRKDLKPIWITRNTQLYHELLARKVPVAKSNSLKGLLLLLKADKGTFTNSLLDLAPNTLIFPKHIRLIALRHGRSVKRVRFARMEHQISKSEQRERESESNHIAYAISTSEFISDLQEECLQIGRHKHVVTGYPRNDYISRPLPEQVELWGSFIKNIRHKKVILYAPSWRHGRAATHFFPFDDFDPGKLGAYLEKHQLLLLLRPHANDFTQHPELVKQLSEMASSSSSIRLATHNHFPDINAIIPFVDVLVSDYSALYHDFLLLNRQVLFIPYDYEEFSKKNGFLYDYQNMLPGPWLKSMGDFINEMEAILAGEDRFADKRLQLTDMIHQYKDDCSCERVVALLDNL